MEGKPITAPVKPSNIPQINVIACDMDLVFMAEACMLQYGHGAFMVCLETLYTSYTFEISPLLMLWLLYDRYIKRKDSNTNSLDMPVSQLIPETDELQEQMVESYHIFLVDTCVYKPFYEEDEDAPISPIIPAGDVYLQAGFLLCPLLTSLTASAKDLSLIFAHTFGMI